MIKHEYIHEGIFEFEAGGSVTGLKVVYHCSERTWQKDDERKVIWICHALTANSDAEDWWPELVGPGKLFDTEKYFVVCANMLGSVYGSSGPSSINPDSGRPYYFDFPKVTVRDIVRANDLVRTHLGIEHIDFMVGGSIGGFQSVEWSIMKPEVIKKAVYIACGARVTPWLTAFNESMRMALEADPMLWQEAYKKGVLIATEQTIMPFLKIMQLTWNKFQHDTNTQRITQAAQNMIDRVGSFYDSYAELGRKLKAVFGEYNKGVAKLQDNGQSITTSARQVISLGVRRSKGKEFLVPEETLEAGE